MVKWLAWPKEMAQEQAAAYVPAQALAVPEGGELENPYDVQFILMGQNLNVDAVRDRIDAMGDSTVVVGDETTIKVHIHVKDPGEPISYGISLGQITDVVVENMQMQMEEIVSYAGGNGSMPAKSATWQRWNQAKLASWPSPPAMGWLIFSMSLGAAYIVNGGQTNNPSTEEIFQAIQDVPTDKVIILPNNKNIILAAEAARDLSPKQVAVMPSQDSAAGI